MKVIITLVISFLLVLFAIFNPGFIEINLFGFGNKTVIISLFVFAVFLSGGIFAGFLALSDQLKNKKEVKKLKNLVKKLRLAAQKSESEESKEKEPDLLSPEKETLFISARKQDKYEQDRDKDEQDSDENEDSDGLNLTASEKAVALEKIKENES